MSSETFGQMLRRFREAKTIVVLRHNATWNHDVTRPVMMSQNELASRAGIDPAYVNKLEAGKMPAPRRAIVLKLVDALELSVSDRDRLLIAAGYWPWDDLDAEILETVVMVVQAVRIERSRTG